jgi:gliding motility-associated-like protein
MRLFIFAISLGFMSLCFAQASLQNSNWMFGATAIGPGVPQTPGPSLNFSNCNPVVENDSPGAQFEGQTAISNSQTGDLLFYSSGSQVRNALGQIMPGGNLIGTSNSISQNLIVKKPGSSTLYYLFTPETQAGIIISTTNPGINGFSYTLIDMSLAGGLGAVVSNGNLLQPFENCEMVTGVYHDNGQDIWIIGHKYGSNTFFAYLLTSAGINPTPIYSSVGPTIITNGTSNYANSNYDAVGELKASPDGTKLAFTTFYNGYTCLFNFNKTNGVISNPIPLNLGSAGYGTSFSPDNSKLYFSRVDATQGGVSFLNNGSIVQFDISILSQAAIQASMYVVYSSSTGFRSLKLGLNGKLYAARTTLTNGGNGASYLAVINNPNLAGAACNFVNDGVFIGANKGRWGLNNVIEDFYTCVDFNFTLGPDVYKCPGASVTLSAPPNQGTYLWNTGASTANITVTQPGTYWVTVTGSSGSGSDTIVVSNFPTPTVNIIGATGVCPGNTTALLSSPNFVTYQWSNGLQTPNITVGPGTYWLTATNSNGCVATDTFTLLQWPTPLISILGNTNVCAGYTTELSVNSALSNFQWNNGLQTQNIVVGAGTYWITAADANGCVATDSFTVEQWPIPVINILGNTIVCAGNITELSASATFTNYQWSNGAQTQNTFVGPGTYWLTATDANGCVANDTITVVESPNPVISILGNTYVCTGQEVLFEANPGFASYTWSNGQNTAAVYLGAGTYSLTVVDSLGCQASQEVTVIESAPTAEITSSINQPYTNGPIQLQSTSTAELFALTSWYWNFDDGNFSNLENPLHTFVEAGSYNITLVVTDELGCSDTASYLIAYDPDFVLYIPNSFTPDGDGLNQLFLPVFSGGIDQSSYQFTIYNRWGEIIFETRDPNKGWDGTFSPQDTPCQSGTYTYIVSVTVPSLDEQKLIQGHVNLIR